MLPPRSTLKRQFAFVSDLFDGRPWTNHESIPEGTPVAPVDQMELVHFNRYIESEDAIKEKAETHRPATHEELYAYAMANPDAGKEFRIAALGSFALSDGVRDVAILRRRGAGRGLDNLWFVGEWFAEYRFLLVRASKPSEARSLGTSALGSLDAWELERQRAWVAFAAAAMQAQRNKVNLIEKTAHQAKIVDAMILEWEARFKKPE